MTLDDMRIDATERTPEIDFQFGSGNLTMRGEAYPEDVSGFFSPILDRLESFLDGPDDAAIVFNMDMIYFNSSSAKVLVAIMGRLNTTASNGRDVTFNWISDGDDEVMIELGQELQADFTHLKFSILFRSDA